MSELGDIYGDRWQDVDFAVSTDEGAATATKFFVNGEEPTRRIVTEGGYRIQGTLAHRIKVVDQPTGEWEWKRLADVAAGDIVPMQLGTLVGEPREVPLPVLDQAYYAGDRNLFVPDAVDADLAELVGYFMGDGSLHAKGVRFCVADTDLDVVERIRVLSKGLFGLEPVVTRTRATSRSPFSRCGWRVGGRRLASPRRCRPTTTPARAGRRVCRRRSARRTTSRCTRRSCAVCSRLTAPCSAAFRACRRHPLVRGGDRTVLLTLGLPTTTRETVSGFGGPIFQVRLRNLDHALGTPRRRLHGRAQGAAD